MPRAEDGFATQAQSEMLRKMFGMDPPTTEEQKKAEAAEAEYQAGLAEKIRGIEAELAGRRKPGF